MPDRKHVECRDRSGKKLRADLAGAMTLGPGPRSRMITVKLDANSPAWRPLVGASASMTIRAIHRTARGQWIIAGSLAGREGDFGLVASGEEVNEYLIDWGYPPAELRGEDARPMVRIDGRLTSKDVLTAAQYEVVKALVDAGPAGLDQGQLVVRHY